MDATQEQAISQGLRAGSAEAWRALYDAYAERTWRLAARWIGPQQADVADVVQETFLAAARTAAGFDPAKGSVWTWLCGILHQHVALHYRRREQQQRLKVVAEERPPPDDPSAGSLLAAKELAGLVRSALSELPSEYGQLLSAKYLDGCSLEEIAGQTLCSPAAVSSKLARAREAFRRVFARLCPDHVTQPVRERHDA